MTPTKLEATTTAYKARKAASKARSKVKALEYKATAKAKTKNINPLLFNPAKYKCWLTGNGERATV